MNYDNEYQWIWDNMVERNRREQFNILIQDAKEQLQQTQEALAEGYDFGPLTETLREQEKELIDLIGELGGWG
jgi:pSer/pThr/pTyr-binding forkhead associated (FHA) protein